MSSPKHDLTCIVNFANRKIAKHTVEIEDTSNPYVISSYVSESMDKMIKVCDDMLVKVIKQEGKGFLECEGRFTFIIKLDDQKIITSGTENRIKFGFLISFLKQMQITVCNSMGDVIQEHDFERFGGDEKRRFRN